VDCEVDRSTGRPPSQSFKLSLGRYAVPAVGILVWTRGSSELVTKKRQAIKPSGKIPNEFSAPTASSSAMMIL
jgi:hypothetical protein